MRITKIVHDHDIGIPNDNINNLQGFMAFAHGLLLTSL